MLYDVFLSHASADKPAVELLAHKLRDAGLEPFLDKWHLIPGEPWQEALEEALDQSRTCAVFLGKTLGPWQNEEMRSALESRVRDAGFRVIPVLLPGGKERGKEKLPRFLDRLTWVDLRTGLDDEDAFSRLLAGIRGTAPGPGGGAETPPLPYRCMAPPQGFFVHRGEYDRVVEALLSPSEGERAGTVGITTALRGAGGFGKTVLAQEVCWDDRVRCAYPNGILWTTMGESVDPAGRLSRVRDLIRWWTEAESPAFETLSAAGAALLQVLGNLRVVLVVDDVWRPEDITPFFGLGANSALLVTTRDSRTLPPQRVAIEVDAMTNLEAVTLLGAGLPDGYSAHLRALASRLGEWPLLLRIVNRQLLKLIREEHLTPEEALLEIEEAFEAEGLTAFDRNDVEARNEAVHQTLSVSLRRLGDEVSELYGRLAVFPEDVEVPLAILVRLWSLDTYKVKKLCGLLHDLSLLLDFDRSHTAIRLHDVVRKYLIEQRSPDLERLHQRLLAASLPTSGNWADLPPDESYIWHHLVYHLLGAGEDPRSLLLDFSYLQSKLETVGLDALITDYIQGGRDDEELGLVLGALRLSPRVLTRDASQLAGQLWGRLAKMSKPGIQGLLEEAIPRLGSHWLRPLRASLLQPGGALKYALMAHSGEIRAVATVDKWRVITASQDSTLRLWHMEQGELVRVFLGHSGPVLGVAMASCGRIVSCSVDKTVRVWDLEAGECLWTLHGHADTVNAVASLGGRVLSASDDGTLRLWSLDKGETVRVLDGHTHRVNAVAFVDERRAISGSSDRTLRLWDLNTGEAIRVLEVPSQGIGISVVAVLANGCAVAGDFGGRLSLFDLESGRFLSVFPAHNGLVTAVFPLGIEGLALSTSLDGSLKLWNLSQQRIVNILRSPESVISVSVLGLKWAVSASSNGMLRLWDFMDSSDLIERIGHHLNTVTTIVISREFAVTGSYDGTLCVWNLETGDLARSLDTESHIEALVTVDDRTLISTSYNGIFQLWDLKTGLAVRSFSDEGGKDRSLLKLEGFRLISFARWAIRLWNFEKGQCLRTFRRRYAILATAMIDPSHVLIAMSSGPLLKWDLDKGKAVRLARKGAEGIEKMLSVGGGKVIIAGNERVYLYDTDARATFLHLGLTGEVESLTLYDERRALVVFKRGLIVLWDFESGEVANAFDINTTISVVAVSQSCIACALNTFTHNTLRLWKLGTWEFLGEFDLDSPASALALGADGRTLVAGDRRGGVHFLRVEWSSQDALGYRALRSGR